MLEHGSYKIELYRNMIVVRFIGAWNQETSQAMCAEFRSRACALQAEPWACLVDLQKWELGGPETWEPILEVNHWCAQNNQKMEAVVCTQSIQEYILRNLQQALPDVQSEFFSSEPDAIAWLEQHGYKMLRVI
jgi:hypothetical protein